MEKNLEPYVVIKNENITFKGDTPQEQELNKWLYHTTLELNRYQDMVQEILDYVQKHLEIKEINKIYNIIKEWNC